MLTKKKPNKVKTIRKKSTKKTTIKKQKTKQLRKQLRKQLKNQLKKPTKKRNKLMLKKLRLAGVGAISKKSNPKVKKNPTPMNQVTDAVNREIQANIIAESKVTGAALIASQADSAVEELRRRSSRVSIQTKLFATEQGQSIADDRNRALALKKAREEARLAAEKEAAAKAAAEAQTAEAVAAANMVKKVADEMVFMKMTPEEREEFNKAEQSIRSMLPTIKELKPEEREKAQRRWSIHGARMKAIRAKKNNGFDITREEELKIIKHYINRSNTTNLISHIRIRLSILKKDPTKTDYIRRNIELLIKSYNSSFAKIFKELPPTSQSEIIKRLIDLKIIPSGEEIEQMFVDTYIREFYINLKPVDEDDVIEALNDIIIDNYLKKNPDTVHVDAEAADKALADILGKTS